ncbi:uracil permease [Alkalicella caledoniensis]|uniref:Uracil permease n=1 Tax=Alkalicella caledoniensis TaxID=2731377 RepID=A0A7G9WCC1_ALKCA|nr:solute carrier family 23 protein [Alkalicella caledoniensis]QNO16333.1 uracil permease [Alkalicella caledoniensis]
MSERKLTPLNILPLSIQHLFAMFGATILVPALTGLDPLVALFTSGMGTILFAIITKGKVPAYLGSSFAFIAPIIVVRDSHSIAVAMGACVVVGLVYVIVSALVKVVGTKFFEKYLPAVVVGPVIMTIGLSLAGVANDMASGHLPLALITLSIVIAFTIFGKGMLKIIPILLGIAGGYVIALIFNFLIVNNMVPEFLTGIIGTEAIFDFSELAKTSWMPALPNFIKPEFEISAMVAIVPFAIVTLVEHLGDVLAIGKTVEQDFVKEPGLHRTILGDGVATLLAAFVGGPPNTTYGENIGVLAITKVREPIVVQVAALIVLVLSFLPKFGALLATIPVAVMGGIVILLFGMISSVGIRTLVDSKIDLANTRNLIIVSSILIFALSGIEILGFYGMGLGALVGIFLNAVLPEKVSK